MNKVIEIRDLTKTFQVGDIAVHALRGIDLTVHRGEFVAIMGSSGSGKSTLMNLLGCLDTATSGEYYLDNIMVNGLSAIEFSRIRNEKIGFVFQGFNLLSRTSALENVELPLCYDRIGRIEDPRAEALRALEKVGLKDRVHHEPTQLSGGQQQRVAVARALVNRPAIILADEPTGNLDSLTSIELMALFQELNDQGITIIIVTHERDIAQYTKRLVTIRDGSKIQDEPVPDRRIASKDLVRLKKDNIETEAREHESHPEIG